MVMTSVGPVEPELLPPLIVETMVSIGSATAEPTREVSVDQPLASISRSPRLLMRQPGRALIVLLVYILVLVIAAGPLLWVFGDALGGVLIIAFACLLSVPVALLAPRPTSTPTPSCEQGPVLRRPRR